MTQASVLASGKLKTTSESFYVRMLARTDLADIGQLQSDVEAMLTNADHLQSLTRDEFDHILSGHGFMIGVYTGEKLIAFRAMLKPSTADPDHLGIDAGLTVDELASVIYSEVSVVHPDYRGNGLQTYMGRLVMAQIDTKQFRYVAATVAPFNIPSLKDKLALGMTIVALTEKYSGKPRYVLFTDLLSDKGSVNSDKTTVSIEDTTTQQHLFRKGYHGIAIQASDRTYLITYKQMYNNKQER